MPKVDLKTPPSERKRTQKSPERRALEDKLIEMFGVCLTKTDLLKVLGVTDRKCVEKWVAGERLQHVCINGRKNWLATDVAKALDGSKGRLV